MFDNQALYTFISTGDKFGFYTFRVMCKVKVYVDGESRMINKDYYVKNLSTNKAQAEQMAEEMSVGYGLPFRGNAEFELEEIKRRNSELVREQREAQERAIAQREQEIQEEYIRTVQEGVIICGKYTGMTAKELHSLDLGYLFWLADQYSADGNSFHRLAVSAKIAHDYITQNNIQKPGYVGVEGEQATMSLKLTRSQWTHGQFPTIMFICTTEAGENVVFFSTAKKFQELEVGQNFTVTALIKEHRENWSGNKETLLNRPKIAK